MLNRITLLRVATTLLYLGPLLAGLAGAGWSMVPIFAALFLLWLILLRPEFASERAWLPRLERALVQTLLVVVFFGLGRGIGGVVGVSLGLPVWSPILLSVAAILLGRLVHKSDATGVETSGGPLRDS
jgi:hypothetical protein